MMNRGGDKGKYETVRTCLEQFKHLDMKAARSAVVSEMGKQVRPQGGPWDALVYDDDAILARFIALALGAGPAEDPTADPQALLEEAIQWAVQEAQIDAGRSYRQHR